MKMEPSPNDFSTDLNPGGSKMNRKSRKQSSPAAQPASRAGHMFSAAANTPPPTDASIALLRELVSHLRQNRMVGR